MAAVGCSVTAVQAGDHAGGGAAGQAELVADGDHVVADGERPEPPSTAGHDHRRAGSPGSRAAMSLAGSAARIVAADRVPSAKVTRIAPASVDDVQGGQDDALGVGDHAGAGAGHLRRVRGQRFDRDHRGRERGVDLGGGRVRPWRSAPGWGSAPPAAGPPEPNRKNTKAVIARATTDGRPITIVRRRPAGGCVHPPRPRGRPARSSSTDRGLMSPAGWAHGPKITVLPVCAVSVNPRENSRRQPRLTLLGLVNYG